MLTAVEFLSIGGDVAVQTYVCYDDKIFYILNRQWVTPTDICGIGEPVVCGNGAHQYTPLPGGTLDNQSGGKYGSVTLDDIVKPRTRGSQPDEHRPEEPQPATESTEQQTYALSTSQRVWNAAYDSLEEEKGAAELVKSYVKTLTTALGAKPENSANVSAELRDPTKRQTYMKELVKEGQMKAAKASKITKGVGDFVQAILSVKPMIDLAIQNIPQAAPAALPWAGVCIGLQILLNPAKATKSNLAGIAHVISRMDWYCALTKHLLNKDNIKTHKESLEAVLRDRTLYSTWQLSFDHVKQRNELSAKLLRL